MEYTKTFVKKLLEVGAVGVVSCSCNAVPSRLQVHHEIIIVDDIKSFLQDLLESANFHFVGHGRWWK